MNVEVNGVSLEYVERGRGEPVVFVHGSASDLRTWQTQQEEFGSHFRAIAYSRRYHWPNQAIAEGADYSMAEHVDDLEALLRALRGAPAHLVGHSYGAFVCLLVAMRAPQLVRALVLAEPPVITLFVSNKPKPSEIMKLALTRPRTAMEIVKFGLKGLVPATAAVQRGDTEEAMRLFGLATLGRPAYLRLSEARRAQVRANLIKAEFLGSGFAPLKAEQVRGIRIPVLLVTGQSSPRLLHRLVDRLGELLPNAERISIDGASHIMHEDNTAAYNAAVLSFLAGHRKATGQHWQKAMPRAVDA